MNDAGKQHKRAWEYDAYNFWVKHNGTPEVRAKEDVENPTKMLRKYASYFDHYEGVKIANICGSCGKKAKNGARSPALRAAVLLIRLLAETPAGTEFHPKR